MNYKKRAIEDVVDKSRNSFKCVLITGARQTGKSFSIRQFGKRTFHRFVEINFIEQPDAVRAFRICAQQDDGTVPTLPHCWRNACGSAEVCRHAQPAGGDGGTAGHCAAIQARHSQI